MSSVPSPGPGAVPRDGGPEAPGRPRRRFPGLTVLVVALALGAGFVWGSFMLIGGLSESNPDLAPAVVVGVLTLLLVLAVFSMQAANQPPPLPKKRPEPEDDGGGGSRREEPAPEPRTPPPTGPTPEPDPDPSPAWDDFDALRHGWERVPAGRS